MASSQRPVAGHRLRDTIQTKLQSEQLQKRKQQAGNALKKVGSQLQKINLGKLIDQMETDQSLADSLEKLNERMKEEVERQEIRREAEAKSMEVIQDHLEVFLQERPEATYEDWIEDLHPENAHQGKLFHDIQEIDARFYVMESDHRRLWNETMQKIEDNEHRIVQPRSQIWGKVQQQNQSHQVDLLSDGGDEISANNILGDLKVPTKMSDDTETETVDFFAPVNSGYSDSIFGDVKNKHQDESEDLIKF
ncbi:hypothetical protein IV203_016710 [Nitzschia inconspicua]|uniref:Uncharacterized protein n=1 Tax=Nitzschia inconspicua TaxID=303405 RepID=A0A9K3KQH8_9STRA|nr:hypothetical protein IV203_016710 [Nitzschia inconspicua]